MVTRVNLLPGMEGKMLHDITFANQTAQFPAAGYSRSGHQVSGPPMIKMVGTAFAAGLLFTLCIALTGAIDFVMGMGVWWAASIAVLAIESALYTWFATSVLDVRVSSLGWSTIGTAS